MQTPYENLGNRLKRLRESQKETLADVSGAVEIDEQALLRFESGKERPAEDILLLLISHFDMRDHEALQLWESAGYDGDIPDELRPDEPPQFDAKQLVVVMGMDSRVLYSDGASISANKRGITFTFTQEHSGQDVPVARVGMSYDQAEEVLRILQRALLDQRYNSGPPQLPAGDI